MDRATTLPSAARAACEQLAVFTVSSGQLLQDIEYFDCELPRVRRELADPEAAKSALDRILRRPEMRTDEPSEEIPESLQRQILTFYGQLNAWSLLAEDSGRRSPLARALIREIESLESLASQQGIDVEGL